MLLDAENRFSNAQAVTSAAASTNHLDMSANNDVGTGCPLYIHLNVDTAFTDTGSNSTLDCYLQGDDDADGTFGNTTNLQLLGTFAATSAAGTTLKAVIDPEKVGS